MSVTEGVTMRDVDSSMVNRIGYNPVNQNLFVEFKASGKQGPAVWRYSGVTPSEWAQMTSAASIGKWFIQNIRGVKTSQRVS